MPDSSAPVLLLNPVLPNCTNTSYVSITAQNYQGLAIFEGATLSVWDVPNGATPVYVDSITSTSYTKFVGGLYTNASSRYEVHIGVVPGQILNVSLPVPAALPVANHRFTINPTGSPPCSK